MQRNFLRLVELPLTLSRSVSELSLESLSMKAFRLPIFVILIKTPLKEDFSKYTPNKPTQESKTQKPQTKHVWF